MADAKILVADDDKDIRDSLQVILEGYQYTVITAGDKEGRKAAEARAVGTMVAEIAKAKGVEIVRFDRGGYLYHGRVAALAAGAREAGLQF